MAKKDEKKKIETEPPVQKAFTLERGEGGWSFVLLTFQGDKVLGAEKSEPDLKAVAIEKFKINAFKYWNTIG